MVRAQTGKEISKIHAKRRNVSFTSSVQQEKFENSFQGCEMVAVFNAGFTGDDVLAHKLWMTYSVPKEHHTMAQMIPKGS
jgi:hypothetical protein